MNQLAVKELELLGLDQRGWAVNPILQEDFPDGRVRNVHIVSLRPGAVRGNHYHRLQREYICIMGSRAEIVGVDMDTGDRQGFTLSAEHPLLVEAPPNVAHAIRNVGEEMMFLFCYADRDFDAENRDAVGITIIEGNALAED